MAEGENDVVVSSPSKSWDLEQLTAPTISESASDLHRNTEQEENVTPNTPRIDEEPQEVPMTLLRSNDPEAENANDEKTNKIDNNSSDEEASVINDEKTNSIDDNSSDEEASLIIQTPVWKQFTSKILNVWKQYTGKLRQGITRVVVALSVHAARYPYVYIFGIVLISLGLIAAGAMTNMTINVDPDVLFTPSNTITSQHRNWLANFNPNREDNEEQRKLNQQHESFNPEEDLEPIYNDYQDLMAEHQLMMNYYHTGWQLGGVSSGDLQLHGSNDGGRRRRLQSGVGTTTVLVHANGRNVVTREGMKNLFLAYETIIDSIPVCQTRRSRCRSVSALKLWNDNMTLFEDTVQSDQDVVDMLSSDVFHDGSPIDIRSLAGKAEMEPDGTVSFAASYILLMQLPVRYNPDIFGRNFGDGTEGDYEGDVIQNILNLRHDLHCLGSDYTIELFTRRAFEDELFRGIAEDVPLIPIVFAIMIAFTCFAFFKRDRVKSKCLLGIGGVLTIVLSILSGYGLMFCFAMPFTPMTTVLPFVVLGIGLDDTFIISLAFNRTDENKDPVERIRETMSEVGLSISVTTFTSTLAFLLGLISTIPSIYWLCMYAFATILIDFIYQITFFVALLVLDARRIKANRTDCCTCFTVSRTTAIPLTIGGEEDEEEDNEDQPSNNHFADRVMGWYANKLLRNWTRLLVMVIFLCYFVICVFCTTQMEQAFRVSDLTPDESFIRTFFRSMQDYTTRSTAVMIYFRNVDQSDSEVRREMRHYIEDLVAIPAFGEPPAFCWVQDFDNYVESIPGMDELTFNEQIEHMLAIPEIRMVYGDQLFRNRDGDVKLSRCQIWFSNLDLYDVQNQLDAFRAQREVSLCYAEEGNDEWPFFTWDALYYLWEFYDIIVHELILTTISAVVAVSFVTVLVAPHWTAMLYVLPIVLVLYIDLIGTLQFIGVRINAISYIALVISIGVMVDFILHVLMRYYESKSKTREGKIKDTLQTMGASVLLGGLSTFIATIPVLFASSQLFKDIFYSFFSLVTLSICHGLIFLPVVLSIVGPAEQKQSNTDALLEHGKLGGMMDGINKTNAGNKQLLDVVMEEESNNGDEN